MEGKVKNVTKSATKSGTVDSGSNMGITSGALPILVAYTLNNYILTPFVHNNNTYVHVTTLSGATVAEGTAITVYYYYADTNS